MYVVVAINSYGGLEAMKKCLMGFAALLVFAIWTGWGVAGEKADHVCFRSVDADHDGKVTLKEFAVHYGSDEAMFKAVDSNEDGHLTHEEYHDFLGHGAQDRTDDE